MTARKSLTPGFVPEVQRDLALQAGPQSAVDPGSNAAAQQALDPNVPQFYDPSQTYPLGQPITWTQGGQERTLTELGGNDMNELGRACFAEVSGSLTGIPAEGLAEERRAMVSVILNRLGARGLRGGRADTVHEVLTAPNQFESVTGVRGGPSAKFRDSAPGAYEDLSAADQGDLAACLRTAGEIVASEDGVPYDFTSNRAGRRGRGTNLGGSRFWKDPGIDRNG